MSIEICVFEIRDYQVINHTTFGENVLEKSGFKTGFQVRARIAEPGEPLIRSTNIPDIASLGPTIQHYQSQYEGDMQYLVSNKLLTRISSMLTEQGID